MNRTGPTHSRQSGMHIEVETTWVGSRGYRPVTVTITTAKAAGADSLITIRLHAAGWSSAHNSIDVEHDFEVPVGSTSTASTFLVPQYDDWNYVSWETWVDGVKDKQLCQEGSGMNSGSNDEIAVGVLRAKVMNQPIVNVNQPGSLLQQESQITQLLQTTVGVSIGAYAFDNTNLPEEWLTYSALDVLTTDLSTLKSLQDNSPEKLTALLRWVRMGGNLWVSDLDQGFSKISTLEKILGEGGAGELATEEFFEANLKHWHYINEEAGRLGPLKDFVRLTMTTADSENQLSLLGKKTGKDRWGKGAGRQCVVRSLGFGMVAAFNIEPGQSQAQSTISALVDGSLANRMDWSLRHGNDTSSGNKDFNNLLIPDVGAAPVFEFQLLITLFVFAIGPLNYWLLKRRNQLPLLVVTAPLAALAATLLLFTYGILIDGVGVRVRARTMTVLDQRSGEAASWAWLSYYAGVAPSNGLAMPADTALYPVSPPQLGYNGWGNNSNSGQRTILWADQEQLDSQQFTRGWLGSRTPTQYLALTSRSTKKHLQFQSQAGQSQAGQLSVVNHLGTEVIALFVQDQEGNVFVGDTIGSEGKATLSPSTYVKAAGKLRRLLTANLPQLPAGFSIGNGGRNGMSSDWSSDYNTPMSLGLLELQFEAIASPLATGWKNGTYIAVTASGIEVSLGVDEVTETGSFHVVRGSW